MVDIMEKLDYKRLLIISHNCLSRTGSNGRTLSNYLKGWPLDSVAQLFIHSENPDFDVCRKYFCITDTDIIKSIIRRKDAGNIVYNFSEKKSYSVSSNKRNKNSVIFLMREIAWSSFLWKKQLLLNWVNEFSPEIILIQAGDAGFLFKIALKIAKERNIPIIIYNTEGYYFKSKSYFMENKITEILYPLLHNNFCKQYKKLAEYASESIYNCDMLLDDYSKVITHEGLVIMNSSEFCDCDILRKEKPERTIVYAGNVGVGRYKSIIEFAEEAHKTDNNIYVDVYAKITDKEIIDKLSTCSAIRLKGYVSYEELKKIIWNSKYLLHVENFGDFYCRDLKYAFSTKIADSLATGNCLIVYAPKSIAVSKYLEDKNSSVLIHRKQDIKTILEKVFNDSEYTENICHNGRNLALMNHSVEKNRQKFQMEILRMIK